MPGPKVSMMRGPATLPKIHLVGVRRGSILARGECKKCTTCLSEFKEVLGPDGNLVEGCEKCWKNANYEGPVPQLVLTNESRDTAKKASFELKKLAVRENTEKENRTRDRYAVLDQRINVLKSKAPLQKALDAMIRQITSHNMSEVELFNAIDQDGNGMLERGEMLAALRKLGVKLSSAELDGILRTIDQDGNGTIDYQEFYYLIKTERDRLSGKDGRQDCTDRLFGFHLGQRVRVKVAMWTEKERQRKDRFDYIPDVKELGTIQGPGVSDGTLLVKLDRDSQLVSFKPTQVTSLSGHELRAHPAWCMCHACIGSANTDDEDNSDYGDDPPM